MVDVLAGLVIEEVADVAVVARHVGGAGAAGGRHGLPLAAGHAAHLADGVAVHAVVSCLVVAQPGGGR